MARIPAWMKTWWGRLASAIAGLTLVVTLVLGVVQLGEFFGWIKRPGETAPPATSPTTEGSLSVADGYQGGWGPDRDTFSFKSPAPYAVLNSIIDNPVQGDERNFVQVRMSNASAATYTDRLAVGPGDTVVVFAAVANDAADNLASSAATLHGLNARALFGMLSDTDAAVGVQLSAKNAVSVWDGATLLSDTPIVVKYVAGSAIFHTNHGEFKVADLSTESALLGSSSSDGEFPVGWTDGVYEGFGYLTFEIVIEAR